MQQFPEDKRSVAALCLGARGAQEDGDQPCAAGGLRVVPAEHLEPSPRHPCRVPTAASSRALLLELGLRLSVPVLTVHGQSFSTVQMTSAAVQHLAVVRYERQLGFLSCPGARLEQGRSGGGARSRRRRAAGQHGLVARCEQS